MERIDDRLFPVLLLGVQAAVWPGAALLRGAAPTGAEVLAAALVYGLVTVALAVRRTCPVPVLALVAATCALGAGPLPVGATAIVGTAGVALALYTVAAERETWTALLCVTTLAAWQAIHGLSLHGLGDPQGLDLVLTALLYAAATGIGMHRRRRRLTRRSTERRLHRAEAERHRLPAAERRRMERELHDVSAHHLTGVVVTVEAALGLRDRRPEMAAEAVKFAAETGREVTRALSAVRAPEPSAEEAPAPEERLSELVAGFRTLGQPVTCDIRALPEGAAGDAAYGIVREALTNAVRHASGTATTVRCAYADESGETIEVLVRNAPPNASVEGDDGVETGGGDVGGDGSGSRGSNRTARGAGLGGGRGQHLLRGRAREAGGTLTSGPISDGGWEVRAVLPGRAAAGTRSVSVPRSYRFAQLIAAVGLCLQPLLPLLVIRQNAETPGSGVSAGVLFALLATGQALALLWTRRAPRMAFAALLVLAALWPAAMSASGYAGPAALPPSLSMLATCAALVVTAARTAEESAPSRGGTASEANGPHTQIDAQHANGLTRGPSWITESPLLVPPLVAALVHAATATWAVLARGGTAPASAVIGVATAGAALAAAVAWGSGLMYGKRKHAARAASEHRIAAWTEEAVRDAWAERRRITAGLETTVLERTAEVVTEAEAGRLEETAERAREALAAMRALLETVRGGEADPELRPQPTLHALDLLIQQCRATGREVEARRTDRVPERLPTEVDLTAYRAAETVLEAGGEEPAHLEIDAGGDELTLTATGVSRAARRAADERIAARAEALGGSLTTDRPGTVLLRLPLEPGPYRLAPSAGAHVGKEPR
ncbi:histidine kinase [Streptomyces sp. ODS28]|uniref:sensor histidine kinase n=1 Tax=Streptomyces sp. ODS28 TaxID=3136688 RepID=UPI0031E70608